ncbi:MULTISPECIES: hypothetical protein [unclassified Brenneria]|uniref:hypothetical protein n=1 Tax=unclassified Brenneria TaxID=2634434 RepID=UPI0029C1263B|nr:MULTISPECIES: hypothetical protein [unclassified Brenneria]MDX5630081.1 hypothetical protein [Brenneria sp. L3-3Z]MDX5697310.1 hypothetical protein [Brenneria sp. L4-2C]MEE3664049.1 hypothetical protein [Brenneria sp. g21c3]
MERNFAIPSSFSSLTATFARYQLSVFGCAGLDVESFSVSEGLLLAAAFTFNPPGRQLGGITLPDVTPPRSVHGVVTQFQRLSPVAHAAYTLTFESGSVITGRLDEKGYARHENLPDEPGNVRYELPPPKPEPLWEPWRSMLDESDIWSGTTTGGNN